jgi:hypothetical protein
LDAVPPIDTKKSPARGILTVDGRERSVCDVSHYS